MNKAKFIALDTNIFIYYFNKHKKFGPYSKSIISNLVAKRQKAIVSTITISELLSLKSDDAVILKLKQAFLEIPNLTLIDVDHEIAEEAARISRIYDFRLPDCIHLSTALSQDVDYFVTNDDRLKKFKELKIKLLTETQSTKQTS